MAVPPPWGARALERAATLRREQSQAPAGRGAGGEGGGAVSKHGIFEAAAGCARPTAGSARSRSAVPWGAATVRRPAARRPIGLCVLGIRPRRPARAAAPAQAPCARQRCAVGLGAAHAGMRGAGPCRCCVGGAGGAGMPLVPATTRGRRGYPARRHHTDCGRSSCHLRVSPLVMRQSSRPLPRRHLRGLKLARTARVRRPPH